jgi:hypothetical protein
LLLQCAEIDHVPVLGELFGLDTPDVYRMDRHLLTGRRDAEKSPAVRPAPGIAGDDLVACKNAILDRDMKIRKGLASVLQPAMLRIGLGEQRLQRGNVASVDGRHVPVKQRDVGATSIDAQAPDCAFAFMVVSAEPAMAADTSNARRSSIFFSFAVQ